MTAADGSSTPMPASGSPSDAPKNRRIDRIREASYVEGLHDLGLDELRARRDECLVEREHLSMLRRLVQGRAEILQAEVRARDASGDHAPLIESLAQILAPDDHPTTSRGEAVRVSMPEDEMLLARRRAERLVNDASLSNPSALDDAALADAIARLADEEQQVSTARSDVIRALDALQDELKRRYRDDPTLALR
ncbi:MAG TPA: aerial mycelium formation protein [Actinomycetota bacterium]|nr:aerial mycelium formation protein [Actinomycetota bacterium]